jgi:hypothetical protein
MEITEPVILEIPQGRKKVRVELTSRADGRDLIAAIAAAMLRLPDDGEGHADSHGEPGGMSGDELDTAIGYLRREELQKALHYAHGYCAAGVEQAVTYERRHAPHDDGTSYCTSLPEHDHADGQGGVLFPADDGEDGPVDDEAELRRAEKLREDWKPVLAGLGERVAVLSETPEPEWDGDPKCDSLHPSLRVACEAHKPGLHIAPGFNEGDSDITWPRTAPLASVTPLRADEREPARIACPWVHPSKETPCIGAEHHGPPCRDLDGDEWVPGLAVSS